MYRVIVRSIVNLWKKARNAVVATNVEKLSDLYAQAKTKKLNIQFIFKASARLTL